MSLCLIKFSECEKKIILRLSDFSDLSQGSFYAVLCQWEFVSNLLKIPLAEVSGAGPNHDTFSQRSSQS